MSTIAEAMQMIATQAMLQPVPLKILNYKFHEVIGSGSFGTVMRATWTPPEEKSRRSSWSTTKLQSKVVAVKIINKAIDREVTFKNEMREAMEFELSLMPELDHPNIVKCYEVFESNAVIYISLEFLAGGALFDRIYNDCQKFTESHAIHIAKSILEGVKYLHDHDIVHHDLKPENIMMRSEDAESDIVIVDFGLAQRAPKDGVIKNTYITEEYAAPEMLWGKDHGKPIDLWALGVIVHELLDGHLPFRKNGTYNNVKAAHCQLELPYPYWNDISDEAISFLKCLLCEVEYRLTAAEALKHRWFRRSFSADEPVLRGFHDNFNARRSWKKGMNSAIAAIRISSLPYNSYVARNGERIMMDLAEDHTYVQPSGACESTDRNVECLEEVDLSSATFSLERQNHIRILAICPFPFCHICMCF